MISLSQVIYIDMKLEAHEITATSARMEWRHLDEQEEKPHVDGVQVLKKVKDLEANKSNRFVPPASPHPAGHQWNSRISRTRGSLVVSADQLKRTSSCHFAILPSGSAENNLSSCRHRPSFTGTPTTMCWRSYRWWPLCQTIELKLYLLHSCPTA